MMNPWYVAGGLLVGSLALPFAALALREYVMRKDEDVPTIGVGAASEPTPEPCPYSWRNSDSMICYDESGCTSGAGVMHDDGAAFACGGDCVYTEEDMRHDHDALASKDHDIAQDVIALLAADGIESREQNLDDLLDLHDDDCSAWVGHECDCSYLDWLDGEDEYAYNVGYPIDHPEFDLRLRWNADTGETAYYNGDKQITEEAYMWALWVVGR